MDTTPAAEDNDSPPARAGATPPTHFPEWDALLIAPKDSVAAVAAFKSMARSQNAPQDLEPQLPAISAGSAIGKTVNVRFDLEEPDGDHDHCLFKAVGDTVGRRNKGKQLEGDYQADRGATVNFVPKTLLDPDFIYHHAAETWKHFFVSRTGREEYFVVVVNKREKGDPRYRFVSAFPMRSEGLVKKQKDWRRLYVRPKKKKGS